MDLFLRLTEDVTLVDIGVLLSTCILAFIALIVHRHNRNKDRLEFIFNNWSHTLQNNLTLLSNDELLISFEKTVYGDDYNVDLKRARKYYHCFIIINRIQNYYYAKEHKIISEEKFEQMSLPTIRLISSDKGLVRFLLEERGYDEKFAESFLSLLNKAKPFVPEETPS